MFWLACSSCLFYSQSFSRSTIWPSSVVYRHTWQSSRNFVSNSLFSPCLGNISYVNIHQSYLFTFVLVIRFFHRIGDFSTLPHSGTEEIIRREAFISKPIFLEKYGLLTHLLQMEFPLFSV